MINLKVRSTKTFSFFFFGSFTGKSFKLMTIAHKFMIPNGVSSQQANCYQVDGREFPEAVSCMKCYL